MGWPSRLKRPGLYLPFARTVRPQLIDALFLVWCVCVFNCRNMICYVADNAHAADSLNEIGVQDMRWRSPVAPRGPSDPPWYERYWLKIFVFPGTETFPTTSAA